MNVIPPMPSDWWPDEITIFVEHDTISIGGSVAPTDMNRNSERLRSMRLAVWQALHLISDEAPMSNGTH